MRMRSHVSRDGEQPTAGVLQRQVPGSCEPSEGTGEICAEGEDGMTTKATAVTPLAEEIARIVIAEMRESGPVQRRLFTLREACEYTGLSEDAIRFKAAAGQIPVTRIDRFLRFDRVELDRWIRENTRTE
jgi:excisionase family DNA binding protein